VISPRLGRILAVAGGLLAVALLASGCSAVQNLTGHHTGQTQTPRVGDCWRVTYADAAQSEDWEGSGAVSCSAKHESYTYAVTKLTGKYTGSWLDSKGNPRSDVDTAAFEACRARQKTLLPAITPKEALFYPTYYVPSVAQWNGGARWVRCDMTEIKVGSDIAKPKLTTLPAKFADLVKRVGTNPKRFALCENDPANNGPDGEHTMYADCTRPADWTFLLRLSLPGGTSAPYPGSASLTQLGTTKCAAAVTAPEGNDLFAKTPSQTAWVQDGVRTLDCWLNNN
jgi:Septum formation